MFTEDLTQFLKDFGESVVLKRGATTLRTVTAILNAPAQEITVYDRSFYDEKFYSAKVSVNSPHLLMRTVDAAGLRINDTADVLGETYYITFTEADGTGFSLVHLSFDQG